METPVMWFNFSRKTRSLNQKRARRTSFRPTFEALEHRWVPSTLHVLNTADSGPGSLRAEVAAAHNSDTINFTMPITDPHYNPSTGAWTIALTSGELLIRPSLTITGPGAEKLTVSGNNASRVFEVAKNATVTMSGLTISNGFVVSALAKSGYDTTNGRGGGILNHGVLTVSDSTLSHNTASSGSGGSY